MPYPLHVSPLPELDLSRAPEGADDGHLVRGEGGDGANGAVLDNRVAPIVWFCSKSFLKEKNYILEKL
jgi:hypothetical protein